MIREFLLGQRFPVRALVAIFVALATIGAIFGIPQSLLAQVGGPPNFGGDEMPVGAQIGMLIAFVVVILISLAINVVVLYLLMTCLQALPPAYRQMEPGMVWLSLIPCFNLVWNFFVFTRIPKSYQTYFQAQGRNDVGDCGAGVGLAYAICAAVCIIPCINYIAGPAALVLLIIFLVKVLGLKKQIKFGKSAM